MALGASSVRRLRRAVAGETPGVGSNVQPVREKRKSVLARTRDVVPAVHGVWGHAHSVGERMHSVGRRVPSARGLARRVCMCTLWVRG